MKKNKTTKKTTTNSQSLIAGGMFKGAKFNGSAFTNNQLTQTIKTEVEKKCPHCQELAGFNYPNNCQCVKENGYCGHCQADQSEENCVCQVSQTNESDSEGEANEQKNNNIQTLIIDGDFESAEFTGQAFTQNKLEQNFEEFTRERERNIEENKEVAIIDEATLQLKRKFLIARQQTIEELQECFNKLEKKFTKQEKIGEIGNITGSIGGIASTVTFGIPKAIGEVIKSSSNFSKIKILEKSNKEFQISLTDEEELKEVANLFSEKTCIYDILIKDGVWKDRKLTPERMERTIISLSENLELLKIELVTERNQFGILQQKEQTQIRKSNEQELTNQNQKIKEIEEQINDKEKELQKLINSIKEKIKSNFSDKTTKERKRLFEQFLNIGVVDSALAIVVRREKINLAEVTNLQNSIKNLQEQLNNLQIQETKIEILSK